MCGCLFFSFFHQKCNYSLQNGHTSLALGFSNVVPSCGRSSDSHALAKYLVSVERFTKWGIHSLLHAFTDSVKCSLTRHCHAPSSKWPSLGRNRSIYPDWTWKCQCKSRTNSRQRFVGDSRLVITAQMISQCNFHFTAWHGCPQLPNSVGPFLVGLWPSHGSLP